MTCKIGLSVFLRLESLATRGFPSSRCAAEQKEATRINQTRFGQINEAKPETMAVGCPFCMTMME
jgi:Fe-S oxidoreductase